MLYAILIGINIIINEGCWDTNHSSTVLRTIPCPFRNIGDPIKRCAGRMTGARSEHRPPTPKKWRSLQSGPGRSDETLLPWHGRTCPRQGKECGASSTWTTSILTSTRHSCLRSSWRPSPHLAPRQLR